MRKRLPIGVSSSSVLASTYLWAKLLGLVILGILLGIVEFIKYVFGV